jgi:hypothetical protein
MSGHHWPAPHGELSRLLDVASGPWWPGQQDNLQQNNAKRRHSFHDPFHDGDGQHSNYVV